MKRAAAIAAAVAVIIAAVWIRGLVDDPSKPGGSNSRDAAGPLYCDEALVSTCAALEATGAEVIVEPPGATLDRLSTDASIPLAGWVAGAEWPQMADSSRKAKGLPPLFDGVALLGSTPVVMVIRTDRLSVLNSGCGGEWSWKCVAERSGGAWTALGGDPRWGRVVPGVDGADTTNGLACAAQWVTAYFGSSDIAANDFSDDIGFNDYVATVAAAVPDGAPSSGTSAREFLTKPGSRSLVCTSEAEGAPLVARSSVASANAVVVAPPTLAVGAYAAAPAADSGDRLKVEDDSLAWEGRVVEVNGDRVDFAAYVADAIADDGYRVGTRKPQRAATGSIPARPSTPNAGVMNSIRTMWTEVSR